MLMTYDEVKKAFEEEILPFIVQAYEQNGQQDYPARAEGWNNYTDALRDDGRITEEEYDTWENPY